MQLPLSLQKAVMEGRTNPTVFIEQLLGMKLHPGQQRYLDETLRRKTRINLLTCSNRWGKSVLIACLHLWYLYYKFGIEPGNSSSWYAAEYRTANIAPHSALTEAVFKAIHQIMTSSLTYRDPELGLITNNCQIEWWYIRDRTLNTPPYKQFFDNNSYIEHRSLANDEGDALQGKPYGLITYDEGGRSNHLQNEMNDAILPRLMDWHAPFHLLSTPSAASRSVLYHYKLYQDGLIGINSTYAQEGSLYENTFFTPEEIKAQEELYLGNPMSDQVLHGKFVFGGDTMFPIPQIMAIQDDTLNGGIRAQTDHCYAIGVDTSVGREDEFVVTVLDYTTKPFKLVWKDAVKGNSRSPQLHLNAFCNLVDVYNTQGKCRILLETFNGEAVRFWHDLPPYIQGITTCYGTFQPEMPHIKNDNPLPKLSKNIKKADILIQLQKSLAAEDLRIPSDDLKLTQQLSIYREKDADLPTDHVISLALANFLANDTSDLVVPAWQAIEW